MTSPGPEEPPRRRRRAVRPAGTVGGDDESVLRSSFPAPVEPTPRRPGTDSGPPAVRPTRRAPDDLDVGWGGPGDDSNDERLGRERPPHW